MPVVVRNNDGEVIGTSALQDGGDPIPYPDEDLSSLNAGCVWTAVVEDLPSDEDYYSVTVGSRGEQVYSSEKLDAEEWQIDLTLGGS